MASNVVPCDSTEAVTPAYGSKDAEEIFEDLIGKLLCTIRDEYGDLFEILNVTEHFPDDLVLIRDPVSEHSPFTDHAFLPFELVLRRAEVITLEEAGNEDTFQVTEGVDNAETCPMESIGIAMHVSNEAVAEARLKRLLVQSFIANPPMNYSEISTERTSFVCWFTYPVTSTCFDCMPWRAEEFLKLTVGFHRSVSAQIRTEGEDDQWDSENSSIELVSSFAERALLELGDFRHCVVV